MKKIYTLVFLITAVILSGCASITKDDLMGHHMIQSAGLEIKPGAVVLVEKQSPFDGNVVCSSENALGKDITTNIDTIENHTVEGNVFANAAAGILSGKNAGSNNNVYTNIRIETISDTEIITRADLHMFSPACVRAIDINLKAGKPLAMVTSVMIGDANIIASRDKRSALEHTDGSLNTQRTTKTATESKNHKIGIKLSQMQLKILTEEMKISTALAPLPQVLPWQ